MYFDNYIAHPEAKVNPSLLWEYDLNNFDFQQMRKTVVQRVIERGWPEDWYAIFHLYGEREIKNIIRDLPYLNDKDMHFVSVLFEIPLPEMKCYERKLSRPAHWIS